MNKSLIDSLSDLEFKNYVDQSHSINELARLIGYKHSPGAGTKNKLKKRINLLRLELKEKELLEIPKYSVILSNLNTKDIGDIGETHFQMACLKKGITVSKVVGDNKPYEFIMDVNKKLYKIQVKTTTSSGTTTMFSLTSTYRIKNKFIGRIYSEEDIDYFYLYDMVRDEGYLMKPNGQTCITLRHNKSRQSKNINASKDYLFEKVINKLKED